MPQGRSCGGEAAPIDLDRLIHEARRRLPPSHRALLEQIGVQDAVVGNWPSGVRALYQTLLATPPSAQSLVDAVALWLPELRIVAYNGPLLARALGEVTPAARQAVVDSIAWHEYGHALSVARASPDMRRDGPRLVELLPSGLRAAIGCPGGYRPWQVFDEVVANVYALMIGRAVQSNDYGVPSFLHADVYDAFRRVVPWPPDTS